MALWNDCLTGTGTAKTSVIGALGKLIYNKYNPVFGPAAAQAIQAQWDYFDAQQALTAMFLVDYYRDQGEPESARGAINTWQQNRKAQLLLLHGNAAASDTVYALTKESDGKYSQQSETVSLACLPAGMIKAGNWLWLRSVLSNVLMNSWFGPKMDIYRSGWTTDEPSSGIALRPEAFPPEIMKGFAATDPTVWRVPQLATVEDLFANVKAQIGQSQDHFADALIGAGFKSIDGTPVKTVWFYEYRENPFHWREIFNGPRVPPTRIEDPDVPKWAYSGGFFNENDSWDRRCDNLNQPACLAVYNINSPALLPAYSGRWRPDADAGTRGFVSSRATSSLNLPDSFPLARPSPLPAKESVT